MKHVILVIFDSTKYDKPFIDDIENGIKNSILQEGFSIYYLKLVPSETKTPADILYKFIPNTNHVLSPFRTRFDFRNAASLASCIEYIQTEVAGEAKYYLISFGHGSGFGFFRREIPRPVKAENFIKDCSIELTDGPSFDILWNIEFFQALKNIQFELAVFNNCNVTMFENCVLFARSVRYMIATENFQSIDMINLENLLQKMMKHIISQSDLERVGEVVFDENVIGALKKITTNSNGTEKTTLFYLNLQRFEEHFRKFETIVNELLVVMEKDPKWMIDIRKRLIDVSPNLQIVDMFEFFDILKLDDRIPAITRNEIIQFIQEVDASILSKWAHRNLQRTGGIRFLHKFNGISLYFPGVKNFFFDEAYKFNRNILCSAGILKPSNWDKLLDKVFVSSLKE